MLKNERQREIIKLMKNNQGFITVKELCATLYSSESSIRRDLVSLENKGIIKRTYGSAELITNFSNVTSFSHRSHHCVEAKKIIAKKASELIKELKTYINKFGDLYICKEKGGDIYPIHFIHHYQNTNYFELT